jgi:hypothetical protein
MFLRRWCFDDGHDGWCYFRQLRGRAIYHGSGTLARKAEKDRSRYGRRGQRPYRRQLCRTSLLLPPERRAHMGFDVIRGFPFAIVRGESL